MLAATLFATAHGKWVWESEEPLTFNIESATESSFELPNFDDLAATSESDLAALLRGHHSSAGNILSQQAADEALQKTDCTAVVQKDPKSKMTAHGSDHCWKTSWWPWAGSRKGCPSSGWVKYDDFHIHEMKVGKAGISVDENNHVGLVVSDVTFKIKPTHYAVQAKGLWTMECHGIINGVIKGAVNAIEAVIKLSAEGVPVIGEAAASPVDGVVIDVEHVLDGVCAVLEEIIEAVVGLIDDVLKGVLGNALPDIITDLLKAILGVATANGGATTLAPATTTTAATTTTGALELPAGWSMVI